MARANPKWVRAETSTPGRGRVGEPGAGLLVVEAQVFFFHTDETAAVADNQMVQHFNGHQFAGGYQVAGYGGVLRAGRWVAGGVVVDDDDGGGVFADSGAQHFGGTDGAAVDGADVDGAAGDGPGCGC